jgi:hypothetical protein
VGASSARTRYDGRAPRRNHASELKDLLGRRLANKTRSTFLKRQKEVSRQARQKEKQARRLEAKQKTADGGADPQDAAGSEDPDLAGIVLGPQPPADETEADES